LILKHSPELLEAMVNFTLTIPRVRGLKVMGLRCVQAILEFSQFFFQGLWVKDHAYLQLQSFDKNKIAKLTKGKKTYPTLGALVKMDEKERAELSFVPEEDKQQFLQEIAEFPKMTVNHSVFVEDEEEVMVGDILTLKVEVTRENFKGKESEVNYVKSARFPCLKQEKWYIIVADFNQNLIIFQKSFTSYKKVVEEKFKFPANIQGEFTWKLFVKNDCYRELDQEFDVKFKIVNRVNREKPAYHPDDEALDRAPSFYNQMMTSMFKKENDSDEELEEDENQKKEGDEQRGESPTKGDNAGEANDIPKQGKGESKQPQEKKNE